MIASKTESRTVFLSWIKKNDGVAAVLSVLCKTINCFTISRDQYLVLLKIVKHFLSGKLETTFFRITAQNKKLTIRKPEIQARNFNGFVCVAVGAAFHF